MKKFEQSSQTAHLPSLQIHPFFQVIVLKESLQALAEQARKRVEQRKETGKIGEAVSLQLNRANIQNWMKQSIVA